jgi:hypothetical protein
MEGALMSSGMALAFTGAYTELLYAQDDSSDQVRRFGAIRQWRRRGHGRSMARAFFYGKD